MEADERLIRHDASAETTYLKYASIPLEILKRLTTPVQMRELSKYTLSKSTKAFIRDELMYLPTNHEIIMRIKNHPNDSISVILFQHYVIFAEDDEFLDVYYVKTNSDMYIEKHQSTHNGHMITEAYGIESHVNKPLEVSSEITSPQNEGFNPRELFELFGTVNDYNGGYGVSSIYIYALVDMKTMISIIIDRHLVQVMIADGHGDVVAENIREYCVQELEYIISMDDIWQSALILYMHCVSFGIDVNVNDLKPFLKVSSDRHLTDENMLVIDSMYEQLSDYISALSVQEYNMI